MPTSKFRRRLAGLLLGVLGTLGCYVVFQPPAHAAGPRPLFQMPFLCGERWRLATYRGHDDYDIDMTALTGQTSGRPILATYAGTVAYAGWDSTGGGNMVRINHGSGWATLNFHMIATPVVHTGQSVSMGTLLGYVGSTGDSTGPHLHYEQRQDGNKVESWFNGAPSGITSDGSASTGPIFVEGPVSGPVPLTSMNGCATGASNASSGSHLLLSSGVIALFAAYPDGKVYGTNQTTPGGAFGGFQALPAAAGVTFVGAPQAIQLSSGIIAVYARTSTGAVLGTNQTSVGGPYTSWVNLGSGVVGDPTVLQMPNGALVMFAVRNDGQVWGISQQGAGGSWSPWQALPAAGGATFAGTPMVLRLSSGIIVVFARTTTGSVMGTNQTSVGGPYTSWVNLGSGVVGDPTVLQMPNGAMGMFAVRNDGQVWGMTQQGAGGSWSPWQALPAAGGVTFAGQPAALRLSSGIIAVSARTTTGSVMGTNQTSVGGSYASWVSLGGNVAGDPTVLQLPNAAMTMYATDSTGHVWGVSQQGAGGSWGSWIMI